jgi:hypothetical protein
LGNTLNCAGEDLIDVIRHEFRYSPYGAA